MSNVCTVLFDWDTTIEKLKENSVDICLVFNDKYVPYGGVVIRSIVDNCDPDRFYDLLIMEPDITDENKEKIASLVSDHANFQIRFVNVKKGITSIKFNTWGHFSMASYIRLLLLSDFFKNYDKMAFLDSDIICQHDIADLYDTDMGSDLVAAVDDVLMKWELSLESIGINGFAPIMPRDEYLRDYLGLGSDMFYYNAGVMVLNLNGLRDINACEKAIFKAASKGYIYQEQDIFNEMTVGRVRRLEYNWNLIGVHKKDDVFAILDDECLKKYSAAWDDPYIIHYAGRRKPWTHREILCVDNFLFYAKKTIWYSSILESLDARPENDKNAATGSAGSSADSSDVNDILAASENGNIKRREFEIVDNGKKNILIHIGDFDLRSPSTYLIQEFFNRVDTSKADYYVFFNECDLSEQPDRLGCLPSDVKYFSYSAPLQLAEEESGLYQKFLLGQGVTRNGLLDKLFARECEKMFENAPIDLFIDLSGQKPQVSLTAAFLSCPKAVLISEPGSINEYTKEYDCVLVYENTSEIEELKRNTIMLEKGYSRDAMDKNAEQIEKLCGV